MRYQHFIAGWVQTNFTNPEKGNNWEGYSVCDVGYPNVNNWLRTPFIERGEYNRIVIEVNIWEKNCTVIIIMTIVEQSFSR